MMTNSPNLATNQAFMASMSNPGVIYNVYQIKVPMKASEYFVEKQGIIRSDSKSCKLYRSYRDGLKIK